MELKENWNTWNKSKYSLTFERYMILTCQQMYYEKIYEEIKGKDFENLNKEDIQRWNDNINESSKLIPFSPSKKEIADDCVKKIIKIIKVCCIVIEVLFCK